MAKNHEADMENPNKGTSGQNETNKANQDNSANQQNPNHKEYKGPSPKK